jgi:hypothetical protein
MKTIITIDVRDSKELHEVISSIQAQQIYIYRLLEHAIKLEDFKGCYATYSLESKSINSKRGNIINITSNPSPQKENIEPFYIVDMAEPDFYESPQPKIYHTKISSAYDLYTSFNDIVSMYLDETISLEDEEAQAVNLIRDNYDCIFSEVIKVGGVFERSDFYALAWEITGMTEWQYDTPEQNRKMNEDNL